MNVPDDLSLKNEIVEIANKIDEIINTVNQYHPVEKNSDASDANEEAKSD
jgi:hypothetical protein